MTVTRAAIARVEARIDNLLTTADRFDRPGGSRTLARRARDKAAGMETALRLLIAPAFVCPCDDGPGQCMNDVPHTAPRGCEHHSTSGVPDRHDKPGRGDGE